MNEKVPGERVMILLRESCRDGKTVQYPIFVFAIFGLWSSAPSNTECCMLLAELLG